MRSLWYASKGFRLTESIETDTRASRYIDEFRRLSFQHSHDILLAVVTRIVTHPIYRLQQV
jgi:hypothetical protein